MVLGATLAACQGADSGYNKIVQVVSVADFEQKLTATKGAQLVDVRTPEEYAEGHLKGAVNVNINAEDFSQQLGRLSKDAPVFVYCRSGGRSGRAAAQMAEMGFVQVYDMKGGMMAWERAGKAKE